MGSTVNSDKMAVVHKDSSGVSTIAPDVCNVPAPPAPPIPTPFPNIAQSSDTADRSTTVKADGNPVMTKGSSYSKSSGDEAGTLGGLASGQNMAKAEPILYSFTVMIDGFTVRYWDGVSWRSIDTLPNGPGVASQSIASAGPGSVYVGRDGVHKFTLAPVAGGGTWSTLPDPTGSGQDCRGMYGISGRIFCSYADGSVYSWDGVMWTSSGNSGITSAEMIFASDTNDVWVYKDGSPGVLRHYTGAGGWTSAAAPINLSAFHAATAKQP
jgi:hypothetical protein